MWFPPPRCFLPHQPGWSSQPVGTAASRWAASLVKFRRFPGPSNNADNRSQPGEEGDWECSKEVRSFIHWSVMSVECVYGWTWAQTSSKLIFSMQKSSNARWWAPASLWGNGATDKKWEGEDCAAGKRVLFLSLYCQFYELQEFFCCLFTWINTSVSFISALKDHERFLSRCQEMELQLLGKEKEMEQLFQKQRRVSTSQTQNRGSPPSFVYIGAS